MEDPTPVYTRVQAESVLGVHNLKDMLRVGNVTEVARVGSDVNVGYRQDYIDGLAKVLNRSRQYYPPGARIHHAALVELYDISVTWRETDKLKGRAKERARLAIRNRLQHLIDAGKVIPASKFVEMMQPYVGRDGVKMWCRQGRLPVCTIADRYFINARCCWEIVAIYKDCLPVALVADLTGYSVERLNGLVRTGRLAARRGPDLRNNRIPKDLIEELEKPVRLFLSYTEAAQRLGVSVKIVIRHAKALGMRAPKEGVPFLPVDIVEEWGQQLKQLNPGFEWFPAIFRKSKTLTVKQAARQLSISLDLAQTYCREGLLPFYTFSFSARRSTHTHILEVYVIGLANFTDQTKPRLPQAREYLRLCQQARSIV